MYPGFRLPAVLAVAAMSLTTLACGQKVDIKLNLHQGATYHLRTTNDQTTSQTVQGREMSMQQKTVNEMAFAVSSIKDGDITLQVTNEHIIADITSPRDTSHYDSNVAGELNHPMLKALAAMAGQSYEMVIGTDGKLKSLTGMDKIVDRIIESLEMPETPARDAILASIRKNFGEDAFKDQWGVTFAAYPGKPVGPGDSWQVSFETTAGFPIAFTGAWTLQELSGSEAVLGVDTKISTKPGAEPMEMGPMKVSMDIAGTQTGTLRLARDTGWIVGGKLVQSFSGTNKVESGPGQTGGMSWPMTMEIVTSYENY